jgi:predicted cupin superfamily sugar epimerase
MKDADYWIAKLGLADHPEGGHFRETYRSNQVVNGTSLPDTYGGARSFSTSIYYLLKGKEVSRLHRIKSDELWHFYTGSSLTVHAIGDDGDYSTVVLGSDPERGEVFQAAIQAGSWFGATVDDPASYSLVGCTVAPGFEYADFELADRGGLLKTYPQHRRVIERLTV